VYLTVYLFTVDHLNNFTLMLNCFSSSHVLTPVSRQCLYLKKCLDSITDYHLITYYRNI